MAKPTNGHGVDASGGPVVDPTENVKALMEASIKAITRETELQQQLADEKIKRMERELINQEKIANLRAEHVKEMAVAETGRVNAVRQTDQQNVESRARQSEMAVTALDNTTKTLAENIQKQLATTADTLAKQFQTTVAGFTADIGELKKALYTGVGKEQVADPQQAKLTLAVEALTLAMAGGKGKSEGMDRTWQFIAGLLFLFFAWTSWQQSRPISTQQQPLIINVPSLPPGAIAPSVPPQAVPR